MEDADAARQIFEAPVYGDPTFPESEFHGLAVRFARRGLMWVQLTRWEGIAAENRRFRTERWGNSDIVPMIPK